jgi:CYTH domain-containing protein/CHAD domain-containing protein
MAFVFEPTASMTPEVQRVTCERIDEAISNLTDLSDADDAEEIERAVHDTRKRCKEIRAIARLVRSALDDDFDPFSESVRDAADALAPIRDAHALLATFDDLLASNGERDDSELGRVRKVLASAAAEATLGVRGDDPRIDRARSLLAASRTQIEGWHLPEGDGTLGAGIEATFRRGRRALSRARAEPTNDHLHEWRKSVKQLWYQVRLLRRAAPSVLEALIKSLDDLAEALGDDHDLAVLIERLAADPDHYGGAEAVAHAHRLASAGQDDLRRRAFRLGATIYAEKPRAFRHRMLSYWACAIEDGPERATGGIAELAELAQLATAEQAERLASPAVKQHDPTHTVERERKFLVSRTPQLPDNGVALRQGYMAIDGTVSVRVRDADAEGCTLTIKAGRGAVRTELEWPLSRDEFAVAWEQTRGRRIHKTRYRLPFDGLQVELDVFHDALDGLIVAEVEFDSEHALAEFQPPPWFGREVTDDVAYTNAALAGKARPV